MDFFFDFYFLWDFVFYFLDSLSLAADLRSSLSFKRKAREKGKIYRDIEKESQEDENWDSRIFSSIEEGERISSIGSILGFSLLYFLFSSVSLLCVR